jgi:dimethylamine/trimethylamine dehydrogenase
MLAKLPNVEVHTGVDRLTANDVLDYGAEKVVIATGSYWSPVGLGAETHRPIPGADASRPNVLTPEQVSAGKPVHGQNVVILDGDGHFTAISMAELMADQGKNVTLVTNMHDIVEYSKFTMEMPNNKRMMFEKNIRYMTNHWGHSFHGNVLELFYLYKDTAGLYEVEPGQWGRRFSDKVVSIDCDALIVCSSRVPDAGLYTELLAREDEWAANGVDAVYRVGDCVHPRHVMDAIFDGHRLGREFDSPHPQRPLPFIRERQLWGHETYPKLGDERPLAEGPLLA